MMMFYFCISRFNSSKIFKKIQKKNIKIYNIKIIENKIIFSVNAQQYRKAKVVFVENNIEFEILNKGIEKLKNFTFKKVGVLVGIFFCFISSFFLSKFVFQVEYIGVSEVSNAHVNQFLVDQNMVIFNKNNVDLKKAEIEMMRTVPNLSFASFKIVGCKLYVSVKESMDVIGNANFFSIRAEDSGFIEEINVTQGKAIVKKGDFVRLGEELVLSQEILSNGEVVKVEAKATYKIRAFVVETYFHEEEKTVLTRTGRKKVESSIAIFNKKIYSNNVENNFVLFDVEEKIQRLSLGNILPIIMKTKTFYETKKETIFSKYEDVVSAKKKELENLALSKLKESEFVANKFFNEQKNGGNIKLTFVVEIIKGY